MTTPTPPPAQAPREPGDPIAALVNLADMLDYMFGSDGDHVVASSLSGHSYLKVSHIRAAVAEVGRLRSELFAERARLDWLEGRDFEELTHWAEEHQGGSIRDSIDECMEHEGDAS